MAAAGCRRWINCSKWWPASAWPAKSTTKAGETMITPDKAQQDYEAALSDLQEAALTPGMPTAERMDIRDAIRELTVRYLGQVEVEIHALTDQYEAFIAS